MTEEEKIKLLGSLQYQTERLRESIDALTIPRKSRKNPNPKSKKQLYVDATCMYHDFNLKSPMGLSIKLSDSRCDNMRKALLKEMRAELKDVTILRDTIVASLK